MFFSKNIRPSQLNNAILLSSIAFLVFSLAYVMAHAQSPTSATQATAPILQPAPREVSFSAPVSLGTGVTIEVPGEDPEDLFAAQDLREGLHAATSQPRQLRPSPSTCCAQILMKASSFSPLRSSLSLPRCMTKVTCLPSTQPAPPLSPTHQPEFFTAYKLSSNFSHSPMQLLKLLKPSFAIGRP